MTEAMANLRSRAEAGGSLSTTAIVAIVSAIGVVILGLLAALVLLLIRAVRRHKQLLAEFDERGMSLSQAQKEGKLNEVARPRAVLRRNTILPFNAKSGWGTLPSVETIGSAAPSTDGPSGSAPEYYMPPIPIEPNKRTSSLSWPFHSRKLSGHTMKMKHLKVNRLSAVLEDPKPSSLVPILGNIQLSGSRPPLALLSECESQPSSCQSLLQYHPAFRNQIHDTDLIEPAPLDVSKRLQRAKSVTEFPLETERPQIRQRSTSLHSQASGKAPDVILPPLPLDIARIKDEVRRKSQLRHQPSKNSISSFGSTDSSILNPRPSPIIMQSSSARAPKITKRERKNNTIEKMNPVLETRESMYSLHGSMKSSAAEVEIASPEARREFVEDSTTLPKESSTHTLGSIRTPGSVGSVKRAESITVSRVVSARASPRSRTPTRRSKTLVTSSGSPEKYCQITTNPKLTLKSPKRQTSRASSRSSCGNPFQWDPAPIISTSIPPSALKGSPSARQGHRRGHSVRISLVPTIHSIRSRAPSPALVYENEKPSTEMTLAKRPSGLGVSNTHSLPTPPTSETFAPELSFMATSLRASLTPTSAALPLVSYDPTFVVAPSDHVLPELSDREQNRLSTGSVFSLSRFPLPSSTIEPDDDTVIHVPDHSLVFPVPDTPYLQQYPFRMGTLDRQSFPSPTSPIDLDEYDPQQPGLGFETPVNAPSRTYQSACTTIPEESSVGSKGTIDHEQDRYGDSPPVLPKTSSPPGFMLNDQYSLPIYATTIPEEESPRTIDPSVLTRDNFSLLNSGFEYSHGGITQSANSSRTSIAIPATPGLLDPLLNATFSSPKSLDSPTSSLYSSPTHSPHASLTNIGFHAPCSPRPAHASLPAMGLNFNNMPQLHPGTRGPRVSPPKPLRSSIQQLRRMNSDASDARKDRAGRGERRYLRLGRESSVQLSGDESWLDELDEYEVEGIELDDEEVRRLVGTVLECTDDECDVNRTVLDLEATPRAAKALGGGRGVPEDAVTGADQSSSSIWDESDAFWSSSTPPPETQQQTKPILGAKSKKRQFEVAKDEPNTPQESPVLGHARSDKNQRDGYEVKSDRKRNVLGDGTPNVGVRIQVMRPTTTPRSYYDEQGFLRA
ncbi:uncharacterized protein M421DRAFT_392159 [Didymella exigua CBS 183.55]|uniref:Uncharacterized protein n=1 Tax=Didymella exigua CBS 183.55 TaxID=1150837 RepID=A0A6A5RLN8_9PLEO|nr:uncharacterized protein M421DRAFT_392159 [Didymella exigua CBS 183.55]KAF1928373.1 hypothetical protein M421DRAFT_392159 [Didymella exigua CBS 183.55]